MSIDIKLMCQSIDSIMEPFKQSERKYFEDMNILQQRVRIGYYLRKHPEELMRAVNDHVNPVQLRKHWEANDGTAILKMLNNAFRDYLGEKIDAEPEGEQ